MKTGSKKVQIVISITLGSGIVSEVQKEVVKIIPQDLM